MSDAVQLGRWGATLWTWPETGTFAGDRAAMIGNNSGALGHIGIDIRGVRLSAPDVTLEEQYNLDGVDLGNITYGANVVTVPIVIKSATALDAHNEWRRILAAVSSRERRAALQIWDPSTSVQASRWLTELIFLDATDPPLENYQDRQIRARLQFATLGNPWWTPEPIAANDVSELEILTDSSVHQLYITNPGDVSVYPSFEISAIDADIQIQLGGTNRSIVVRGDKLTNGNGQIETDRRLRAPDDDQNVTAASVYFRLPAGESRIDINYFNPAGGWSPAGNSYVQATLLPSYSTC